MANNPQFARVLIENDHVLYVRCGRVPGLTPLRVLIPSYDLAAREGGDPTLSADEQHDLDSLAHYPNTSAFRAFSTAIGQLRPYRRAGAHNGLLAPTDAAGWAHFEQARKLLASAQAEAPHVPSVHVLAALVLALTCEYEGADAALELARTEGESRETLFTAQELALRRGAIADVAAFVRAARRDPRAANDPWLDALDRACSAPPGCPRER